VRVFDLNQSAATTVTEGGQIWSHHDTGACIRVFKCHRDRVKRISTENSSDVFLTCSEDGTVRSVFPFLPQIFISTEVKARVDNTI
jgi:WD40 repeat protein